jgi:hypothetical protein
MQLERVMSMMRYWPAKQRNASLPCEIDVRNLESESTKKMRPGRLLLEPHRMLRICLGFRGGGRLRRHELPLLRNGGQR